MIDEYILDNLDDFDPDSIPADDYSDGSENIDAYSISSTSSLLDQIDLTFNAEDDIPNLSLDNESEFYEDETMAHNHSYSNPTFAGHSLGWNGRCRVCSCGKWAGFGDTCANCGHFYNQHI